MAQPNHNREVRKKQLTAQQVHVLVQQVLQEQWPLDMENSNYKAQDIWDAVIAASVEQLSLEGASQLLTVEPTGRTALLGHELDAVGGSAYDETGRACPGRVGS